MQCMEYYNKNMTEQIILVALSLSDILIEVMKLVCFVTVVLRIWSNLALMIFFDLS